MVAAREDCPEDMTGADSACDYTSVAYLSKVYEVTIRRDGINRRKSERERSGGWKYAECWKAETEPVVVLFDEFRPIRPPGASLALSRQSHRITCDPSFVTGAERRARA